MNSLEAEGDRPDREDLSAQRLSGAGQQLPCRSRKAGPCPSALLSVSISYTVSNHTHQSMDERAEHQALPAARVLRRHEQHTVRGTGSTARPPAPAICPRAPSPPGGHALWG